MREFIAVRDDTSNEDIDLLAGPLEGHENLLIMDDNTRLEDLWVAAGLFPSKTQARKNGHGGPIPAGFTDIPKRKRSIRLTILNISSSDPVIIQGAPYKQAPSQHRPLAEKPLSMTEALNQWRDGTHVTLASLK